MFGTKVLTHFFFCNFFPKIRNLYHFQIRQNCLILLGKIELKITGCLIVTRGDAGQQRPAENQRIHPGVPE